ncbi:MAG: MBG domain-containing protein, partial [Prevotellaceae bacterium]|nr:MBG domain-containing protein [Prevotellaceae bacterium]
MWFSTIGVTSQQQHTITVKGYYGRKSTYDLRERTFQFTTLEDLNTKNVARVIHEPTPENPSFGIQILIFDDSGDGHFWEDVAIEGENKGPAIYIDGEYFASPYWELAEGHIDNHDRAVDGWWDLSNSHAKIYKKIIKEMGWTLRFKNPTWLNETLFACEMWLNPSGSTVGQHTVRVRGGWGGRYTFHYEDHTFPFTTVVNPYHDVFDPTISSRGFAQECWEDLETGKLYSDADYTQELDPLEVVSYLKLKYNPVINISNDFTTTETATYGNQFSSQFDWAASTTYSSKTDTGTRYAEFKINGENPSNARLKWYKDCGAADYGKHTVTVYVNGKSVYSVNQNNGETVEGLFAVPLRNVKQGDVVKFEVTKHNTTNWAGSPTLVACLEYTRTRDVVSQITITADDKIKAQGYNDPELTWRITGGKVLDGYPFDEDAIKIKREKGEEPGTYDITVFQDDGANPDYGITFVDGTFTIYDVMHHEKADPTISTRGFTQECWEDSEAGKFYSADFSQELNPAVVVTYAKLKRDPITKTSGFTVAKTIKYEGTWFDWAASTTYSSYRDTGTRYAEFVVNGENPTNARLKWFKNQGDYRFGQFTVTVYVNGKSVYSINQNDRKTIEGHFAVSLSGLKQGDVVKFEVARPNSAKWEGSPTFAACLEYTRTDEVSPITITADDKTKAKGDEDPELTWQITNGKVMDGYPLNEDAIKISREEGEAPGTYKIKVSQDNGANPDYGITFVDGTFTIIDIIHHEKAEPTISTLGYTQECWEKPLTGKFYSDADCTQELNPAELVT